MKKLLILFMILSSSSCATSYGLINECRKLCKDKAVDIYRDDEVECKCNLSFNHERELYDRKIFKSGE